MFRLAISLCISTLILSAAEPQPQPFRRPIVFEPNHGQAPASVKWIARAPGYRLLLTEEGATIEPNHDSHKPRSLRKQPSHSSAQPADSPIRMKLTGGHPWAAIEGQEPTGGVSNYLRGSDPKKWQIGIPHYAKVTAKGIYDGIDLFFYSNNGDLEYDFVVAPGADPKQIRLAFDGMERLRIDERSGDLLLATASGSELRHMRPKVYQEFGKERVEVAGAYDILDRRQATFTLATFNPLRPLVIDPVVKFKTVLAGDGDEYGVGLATDGSGNSYVTGETFSTNFPRVHAMLADQPYGDAFVTKLSPTGTILFSTYLGGGDDDEGWGIAVDATGIYVSGWTNSTDFPTKYAFSPNRPDDAFITKLNLAGDALIYSSYLGGTKTDYSIAVAVDPLQAAWVVGSTDSDNFPIAGGPSAGQQRNFGGERDAFLARIAPDGRSVAFSTFIGGPGTEEGQEVAVDRTGSIYATGSAEYGFPVTTGMKACGNLGDAFAVRLKGRGTQAPYATCLGPGSGWGVEVDTRFNAYIAGYTNYESFPTTPGAFQRKKPTPGTDYASGFVTKLGPTGKVVYSTFLGGNHYSAAYRIAVDRAGAAYVVGETAATSFPGLPPAPPDSWRGVLSKLSPQGNAVKYSVSFGTQLAAIALFQPPANKPVQVYATGYKNTGKTTGDETDSFVIKWQ